MAMIGGLDVHRNQITYDWVEGGTGEAERGQIRPATREGLRSWLAELPAGEGDFAVEATTGWRFVVEELVAAGFTAHLAEPAETSAARGPKKRAKTDGSDARHQRELLEQDRLPESWIPPPHLLDLRETVRLRKTLADSRGEWFQRIHAALYHHGAARPSHLSSTDSREHLATLELPASTRQLIAVGLRQLDACDAELVPLTQWLRAYARAQPGCQALMRHYGIGPVLAPTILAELGDPERFPNGDAIVRYTGLDITVYASDGKRTPGHLAKQGPQTLRWALYEAAKLAARPAAPEHARYRQVKARKNSNRAALTVARKLARQVRHTLMEVDEPLAPIPMDSDRMPAAA